VKGSVFLIADFTTCGRCGVGLASGCVSLAMSSRRMYYVSGVLTTCEGWMVFVLVGALIMFLAGLFFSGFFVEV